VSDPLLDPEDAAFVVVGVTISVASRDDACRASVGRALGCRVAPDRSRVTLFLARAPNVPLLADLARSGAVSACFSQPSTHRTIQLKGADAAIGPVDARDLTLMRVQLDAKVAELVPLGFDEALVRSVFSGEPDDIVAVTFTPVSAFMQTPGPRAGKPLHP
jgi:hypothetical protein